MTRPTRFLLFDSPEAVTRGPWRGRWSLPTWSMLGPAGLPGTLDPQSPSTQLLTQTLKLTGVIQLGFHNLASTPSTPLLLQCSPLISGIQGLGDRRPWRGREGREGQLLHLGGLPPTPRLLYYSRESEVLHIQNVICNLFHMH